MIKISKVTNADTETLALLARQTYSESHGHFINSKKDLTLYLDKNFSLSKTKLDINNLNNLFYLIYVNGIAAGYVKVILGAQHHSIDSENSSRLERIYISKEYLPLKIGQRLLSFTEEKVKALNIDSIWLSVYVKNNRAIRFYERNAFKNVGELNFLVNGKPYENIVFAKKLESP